MQTVVVALIVLACSVYAVWSLLPAAARRGIARNALKLPLPARAASFMQRHASAASGCGCDGCDHAPSAGAKRAAAAGPRPITFHRPTRR